MAEVLGTETELVPVEKLTRHPRNVRRGDVETIRASIRDNGFFGALVAQRSTGHILVGNHRHLAAVEEGLTEVPVSWVDVDDDRALRIALADNRASDLGTYDDRELANLLAELRESPPALVGTGYDDVGLRDLLTRLGGQRQDVTDPDHVPEAPRDPVSSLGDIWHLGSHRLLCGDARENDSYDRVLGGQHLTGTVITDPPYGVAIGEKNRALAAIDRAGRVLTDMTGDLGIKEVEELWRASFGVIAEVLPAGSPYYIFGPQGGDLGLLLLLLREAGLEPRHILIWVKNRPSFSIGRLDYDYQHEPIAYGWKPGAAHPWYAQSPQASVLHVDRPTRSPEHATTKPVGVLEPLIVNSTRPGEMVLDPFGGSGSTLIAAHQVGRLAHLIEIDPHYCDVTCRRFQKATGIVPERDGAPFDFLGEA